MPTPVQALASDERRELSEAFTEAVAELHRMESVQVAHVRIGENFPFQDWIMMSSEWGGSGEGRHYPASARARLIVADDHRVVIAAPKHPSLPPLPETPAPLFTWNRVSPESVPSRAPCHFT